MADATVQGMQELLDSMEELPLTLQKLLIARALRAGSEPIRQRAEELAPRETGNLAESMMTSVREQTASEAIAHIGPSRKGFYGSFHELGTAEIAAKPFLRPAFDEKLDEATRLIGENLADGIEKAFKKLGI